MELISDAKVSIINKLNEEEIYSRMKKHIN